MILSNTFQLADDISSGAALADPTRLNAFALVTHADLKKFQFHYWFAFPAVVEPPVAAYSGLHPLPHLLAPDQVSTTELFRSFADIGPDPRGDECCRARCPGVLCFGPKRRIRRSRSCRRQRRQTAIVRAMPRQHIISNVHSVLAPLSAVLDVPAHEPVRLASFHACAIRFPLQLVVGFVDPSGSGEYPGWPLRTLISLLHATCCKDKVRAHNCSIGHG